MDRMFEWDEDILDFIDHKPTSVLGEGIEVTALLKVSTINGGHIAQTNIKLFFNEKDELDEDLFELIVDEPVYLWGKNGFEPTDLTINKVYEVIDWRVD